MAGIDDGKDSLSSSRFDGIGPRCDAAPRSTEETAAEAIADSSTSASSASAVDSNGPKMAKIRALKSFVEDLLLMTPFKVPLLSLSAATTHKDETNIPNHSHGRHRNNRTE